MVYFILDGGVIASASAIKPAAVPHCFLTKLINAVVYTSNETSFLTEWIMRWDFDYKLGAITDTKEMRYALVRLHAI